MDIGISTASLFNKLNTEDCFKTIADMGAGQVEVFLNSFCEYEQSFIDLIKKRVLDSGLSVYSVHPLGSQFESQLFSIHPRQKADAFDIFKKVLRGARALNAGVYVLHGAAHLGGAAKNLQTDRVVGVLNELMTVAEDFGITLALENVSWCMYRTADYGRQLAQALANHRLKFVLDIKQAVRSGADPFDFVAAVGEDIINVHLCDYTHSNGKLSLRLPGEGDFDFASLFTALSKKSYGGPAFIEVYSDMFTALPQLEASFQHLQTLANSL